MNPKYQEIIGLWREIPTVKNIMMEKNIERTNLNYTLDWSDNLYLVTVILGNQLISTDTSGNS